MSTTILRRLLPRSTDYRHPESSPRIDLVAGLTVAVVALPLALAFGVTAGLGGRAGLVTAIVAGIVAAIFGGSDVQVSGPTGAMTVVLVPIVARHGADAVMMIGLIAGLILVAAAIFNLGRAVSYMPWPVVEGFTAGIAIIIFLQQVPTLLGIAKPEGENAAAVAVRALAGAAHASPGSILIGAAVAAVMVSAAKVRRSLPASLIAVAAGTALAWATGLRIDTIGAIPSSLPAPNLPNLASLPIRELLGPALAVAALAAIESLLSAKVADGMADGRAHDPDRELLGQGLANIASPLFGGMPATGAIARTAVNVRAGARSRLSAIVHGIVLLGAVVLFGHALRIIPMAALAGVLMVTAARMVDVRAIRMLLRSTKSDAAVLAITTAATVAFDLVVAIEVGVLVAGALALRAVAATTSIEHEPVPAAALSAGDEERLLHDHIVAYRLDGALFFGAAQRFLTELASVASVRVVILRLSHVQLLDATGAQALGIIAAELEAKGITVLFGEVRPRHARLMSAVGTLRHLSNESHLLPTLDDAIAHARIHAADAPHVAAPAPAANPAVAATEWLPQPQGRADDFRRLSERAPRRGGSGS